MKMARVSKGKAGPCTGAVCHPGRCHRHYVSVSRYYQPRPTDLIHILPCMYSVPPSPAPPHSPPSSRDTVPLPTTVLWYPDLLRLPLGANICLSFRSQVESPLVSVTSPYFRLPFCSLSLAFVWHLLYCSLSLL